MIDNLVSLHGVTGTKIVEAVNLIAYIQGVESNILFLLVLEFEFVSNNVYQRISNVTPLSCN